MNKVIVIVVVLVLGAGIWTYRGLQAFQAWQLAVATLSDRDEITSSIGAYEINYDWWFGVFRALRYGSVQEFEFHLVGERGEAVSAVDLQKNAGWEVTCLNVVNGEFLNNRIVQDC